MSYQAITTTEINTGKPVSNELQNKIKENFEDHESRIQDLENGSAVAYPPIYLSVLGYYGDQGAAENWLKYHPNFDIRITGIRLIINKAGTAGTTEIDIQKKTAGVYSTVFTTKPSVAFGAGDDATSSNQVLDNSKVDVAVGEILRLDTTSVQTNGHSFYVRIDYIKV